ncbi:hypothetical protein LZP73_04430 [Shewanella sp. AS16]|uniref:hypothetical protein n=1 Tax=Shewanella sp. AS16 TaxID=2907625 RepID=UPI001F2AAC23|nr:hypothetical protein [Shewanella sp. AS16]MCE9685464.1 hypothetical protein [Shewanella sp. AS16]
MFAYCLCPSFLDDLNEDLVFPFLFGKFSSGNNKVILDKNNLLMCEYSLKAKENDLFDFISWEKMLSRHETCIYSDAAEYQDICDLVFNLTRNAFTTNCKSIVSSEIDKYSIYRDEIKRENIFLSTLKDANSMCIPTRLMKIVESELYKDVEWCIQSLPDRHIFKGASEDEYNDQVRDLMLAKDYVVADQTRRGVSSKGYKAGEVDLLIKEGSSPYSIIEGMKLGSVKAKYIHDHLNKSLSHYDALGLRVSFLVTYYDGKNFVDFCSKYKSLMGNLPGDFCYNESLVFNDFKELDSRYNSVKSFVLSGSKNGGSFINYQLIVKVS